jgi:hypothetical protein
MIRWLMNTEQLVEVIRETGELGENLPQYHFIHWKSHMTWPDLGWNSRHRGTIPATNRLSYDTIRCALLTVT